MKTVSRPGMHVFNTRFGEVAVVWFEVSAGINIRRIFPGGNTVCASELAIDMFPEAVAATADVVSDLARKIVKLLEGARVDFGNPALDFSGLGPNAKRVLEVQRRIPRGEVRTYGEVASEALGTRAARFVGRVLAENPFPLVIPCHRTVSWNGAVGGYQGGTVMKTRLLRMEGAPFDERGRLAVRFDR